MFSRKNILCSAYSQPQKFPLETNTIFSQIIARYDQYTISYNPYPSYVDKFSFSKKKNIYNSLKKKKMETFGIDCMEERTADA